MRRSKIQKEIGKERRKYPRSKCMLPAEVIKAGEDKTLFKRMTVRDFSREGLKLIINFNLNLGSNMEIKLYLPERSLVTSILGEIVWIKHANNKVEAGLKIKDMDQRAKEEILNWLLPQWLKDDGEKDKRK